MNGFRSRLLESVCYCDGLLDGFPEGGKISSSDTAS